MKALVSVYNKRGIDKFSKELKDIGFEILSTEGTYRFLKHKGIKVKKVSDYIKFPEVLGGRVKTLHPKIFAGILAQKTDELKEYNIPEIDMVIVNLYPFFKRKTIENIDIGGVSLLRAAAKNYQRVIVLCDSDDYGWVLEKLKKSGNLTLKERKKLAEKVFAYTSRYEIEINKWFSKGSKFPLFLNLSFKKEKILRYGENPQQEASYYKSKENSFFKKLSGKELSFNNILDINASLNLIREFNKKYLTAVFKHTIPCGIAYGKNEIESFKKAFSADPISPFGGVVVFNFKVKKELAKILKNIFFEIIIFPDIEKDALKILKEKKRLIIVKYNRKKLKFNLDLRFVNDGVLVQDTYRSYGCKWKKVAGKDIKKSVLNDLKFAWKVVKFLKSNSCCIVKDKMTVGIGSGQPSRIGAVELAVYNMRKFHKKVRNLVLASDGFFPFPDSIKYAKKAGIKAIVVPSGSKNDFKVIEEAKKQGLTLYFTNIREFFH